MSPQIIIGMCHFTSVLIIAHVSLYEYVIIYYSTCMWSLYQCVIVAHAIVFLCLGARMRTAAYGSLFVCLCVCVCVCVLLL